MPPLRIVLGPDHAPVSVLTPQGELRRDTADELRSVLHKQLLDRTEVLVDVSSLTVTTPPAVHVFPWALAAAGGWPTARLVLFGARGRTREVLRTERIPLTVPLAPDQAAARPLLGTRPERISRRTELIDGVAAAGHARAFVEGVRADWGLTARFPDATLVVTELVTNAVTHAGGPSELIVSLDQHGLHLAVRDASPNGVEAIRSDRAGAGDGRGLYLVAELSRTWGVTPHPDGKTVWAVLRR